MNVTGTIIAIENGVTIAKQGGGSYTGTRMTYRDSEQAIKEKLFHSNVLKFNPSIKDGVSTLVSGDPFTMVLEKEGEFWNAKTLVKGSVAQAPAASAKTAASPAPKSTYQTAEERAATQVYIVRQSTITQAINLIVADKSKPTVANVLAIAKQFEDHVFGNKADKTGMDALIDLDSDIM
jgi:hypothetical protein